MPTGERLAAVSAIALLVLMLLDWFGGRSAWQLRLADVMLLGVALFAVAIAAAGAAGRRPLAAERAAAALTVAGGLATGAIATLVLESSGGTIALVLSLAAACGVLAGGLMGRQGGGAGPSASGGTGRGVPPAASHPGRPFDREPPAA